MDFNDPKTLIMLFNIGFGVLVFLRAFIGFLRGTRKSVFYLICTLLVYVGGWFAMNWAISKLMDLDLTFLVNMGVPGSFSFSGITLKLTSLGDMIKSAVTQFLFYGQDITNTVTLSLITAVVTIALRIVYFIVLIILSDTVLKWLFNIIWLIIRPKKKANKKGKMKRPKPNFWSRLGGFGIGAVKGAFLLLILFSLIGGISTLVEDANDLTKLSAEESKYDLVMISNSFTLVEEKTYENPVDDFVKKNADIMKYIDLIAGYRETIPGKIYGTVKIDGEGIDEYIFDKMLEIDVDYQDGDYKAQESVQLRRELRQVMEAYKVIAEKDPDFIGKVMANDLEAIDYEALAPAIEKLADLKLVKVVLPVAVETVFLSEKVQGSLNNETITSFLKNYDYKEIRNGTDLITTDIASLGYIFVDALDLIKFGEVDEMNIFDFDQDLVKKIFDQAAELGILDYYVPMAIDYVLTLDSVKEIVESYNIDFDEIKDAVKGIESWGDEVAVIGQITEKLLNLGFDGADLKAMDFSNVNLKKVEELVKTIFTSQLIKEGMPILAPFAIDKLKEISEDASSIVEAMQITGDTDWESELTPLLKSAVVLLQSGVMDIITNGDLSALENISEYDIEKVAEYICECNLVTQAMNVVISTFLNGDKIEFFQGIEIEVFTEEEIAAGTAWTKEEIANILLAARDLISTGILSSGDISLTSALEILSDDLIDSVTTHLSGSEFFKRNLGPILDKVLGQVLEDETIEITVLNSNEWTKEELSSIFNSITSLLSTGILEDSLNSISSLADSKIEEIVNNICESKFFMNNFGTVIDFALGKANLEEEFGLKLDSLKTIDWDKNEITCILKAARDVLDFANNNNNDFVKILASDNDALINNVLNSKAIVSAIGSYIKSNSEPGKDLEIIKGADELIDDDWSDTILTDEVAYTINNKVLTVENAYSVLSTLHADRLDVYVDGVWYAALENGIYTFEETPTSAITVKARVFGELRKIFIAFAVIGGDAFVGSEIDSDALINNITKLTQEDVDKVCDSIILNKTIVDYLEHGDLGTDALVVNDIENLNSELSALVSAMNLLFGDGINLSDLSNDTTALLKNAIKLTNDVNAAEGDKVVRYVKDNSAWHMPYNEDNFDTIISNFAAMENNTVTTETYTLKAIANSSTYSKKNNTYTIRFGENDELTLVVNAFGSDSYKKKDAFNGFAIDATGKLMKDADGKMFLTEATINSVVDYNCYEEQYIDADQIGMILKSNILVDTIQKFIEDEAAKEGSTIIVPEEINWRDFVDEGTGTKTAGEVRNLFTALGALFSDGNIDLDNIDANLLFDLDDEGIDKLLTSDILVSTIKKIIIDLDERATTGDTTVFVREDVIDTIGWKKEIKAMVKAIKLVLGEDVDFNNINVDANKVLCSTDEELTTILSSTIVTDTLIKVLYDQSNYKYDGSVNANPGSILMPLDSNNNPYTLESDFWRDNGSEPGEIRKLFAAIQAMFTEEDPVTHEETINIDLDNIDANAILDLTDARMDTLLSSDVLLFTVKKNIVDLDERESTGDTTIFVRTSEIEKDSWGWKKEIKAMVKAVKIVLGDDPDLNNANPNVNEILASGDEELDIIFGSIIITDTLIKALYDQSNYNYDGTSRSGGTILIPLDSSSNPYTLESSFWRDNGSQPGEVRKIFKSIQALFTKEDPITHETTTSIDFDNISADAILDLSDEGVDNLLASDIMSFTIRKYIMDLDTRATEGTTTIYVNEANILALQTGDNKWSSEIKALLKAFKLLITPDVGGNYSLENANSVEINNVLDPDNKTVFLNSIIISDTIIANLEDNTSVYTRDNLNWYGTTGELSKFIDAAALVLVDDGGNVDINNFSEDNLTSLTNNHEASDKYAIIEVGGKNHKADEVGILIDSTVLRDTIVKNIMDIDSIESYIGTDSITDDAYWADNGSTTGEVRNLLTSFKIIIGTQTISSFTFNMDSIMARTDEEIRTAIDGSDIIRTTCANTLVDTLYGPSLVAMIAEPNNGDRVAYVKNDQSNLFIVFKHLDDDFGISYDSLTFDAFTNAANTDSKAYLISDTLCGSNILQDSFNKMFKQIINENDAISASLRTKISTAIDNNSTWANPECAGSDKQFGELALLFRAMNSLNDLGGDSSVVSASTMNEPLQRMNSSKILQPVVSDILMKALDSVSAWKKSPEPTLSAAEWSYEIALMVDLVDFAETTFGDLSAVTNAKSLNSDDLEDLIKYISKSRILDVNNINDIVETAVNSVWSNAYVAPTNPVAPAYLSNVNGDIIVVIANPTISSTDTAVMTISGYINDLYDAFVDAWDEEAVDISSAIAQLKKVNLSDASNYSQIYDDETGTSYIGYVYLMRMIGRFLDRCEASVTLSPTVSSIATNYLGSDDKGEFATWELAFADKAAHPF